MKILVTGGLGYIGSHTVVELLEKAYEVVIVDDLSNSSIEVLYAIEEITGIRPEFIKLDLKNKILVGEFFNNYKDIMGVVHFAASKAVGESVEKPLSYYENNIIPLLNILSECKERNISNFIFSSSCTVYGQATEMPISEEMPVQVALSPYGNTKKIGEEIIRDVVNSSSIKAILLRYFNPIGAHSSLKIGEKPNGIPQNLLPYITETAIGIRKELYVFGDDYPTRDGSCIRDYIHVVDLAKAHVKALAQLINNNNVKNLETYNIGTGIGYSVFEVINAFEDVSGIKIPFKVVSRRKGDICTAYAKTDKANCDLDWKSTLTLNDALDSAWQWQRKISREF